MVSGSLGNVSSREKEEEKSHLFNAFGLHAQGLNLSTSADLFATVVFSAQYGNFQRLLLDLTRFNVRMDFPSGSKFLSGATRMAYDLYNCQAWGPEAVNAVYPNTSLSFQQQVSCFYICCLGNSICKLNCLKSGPAQVLLTAIFHLLYFISNC